MKQNEIINKIKALKPILSSEYGIDKIGVFGSYANNTYSTDSDVDVLIEKTKALGWKFFTLKDYLEEALQKKVDLVTENSIRKEWKEAILREVIYV
jgi:predicted nucleotidyltransferase